MTTSPGTPQRGGRWTPWILFLGLALTYGACTPGTVRNQGYAQEEVEAAAELGRRLGLPLKTPGPGVPTTRHGLVEPLVKLPFVALGELAQAMTGWHVRGRDAVAEGVIALEPVVLTSMLLVVLFLWLTRLTRSVGAAWLLVLVAAFGTMLWPYAYIGLEATQSLALLLAGALALGQEGASSWRRALAFAVAGAVAVSAKSTGVALLPAVAWLAHRAHRPRPGEPWRAALPRLAATVLIIFGFRALMTVAVAAYFSSRGGLETTLAQYLSHDILLVPIHVISFLASPNKGLLVFAPVAFLGLCCLGRAWRRAPDAAAFALLALAGLALGYGLLACWTDETWGPRYLHAAVAPLIVVLGAAWRELRGRTWLLSVAAAAGVVVSALGVAVEYGALHKAAMATNDCALSTLQHDPTWNHPRFNLRVLRSWWSIRGDTAASGLVYLPDRQWWCDSATSPVLPKAADISSLAHPQPLLLRAWSNPPLDGLRIVRWALLTGLLAGSTLLTWGTVRVRRGYDSVAPPSRRGPDTSPPR